MANCNMANWAGQGWDRSGRITIRIKWLPVANQKRQKRQAQSKSFARPSASFLIRQSSLASDLAGWKRNPHPGPLPSNGRGRLIAGGDVTPDGAAGNGTLHMAN